MSKTIAILCKSKDILNQKSLYILDRSPIVACITYCMEVWETITKQTQNHHSCYRRKQHELWIKPDIDNQDMHFLLNLTP